MVEWKGDDITRWDDEKMATFRNNEMGFIFQFHHLLPEFSAIENVMIPAIIQGKSEKESNRLAKELLDEFELSHRTKHRPNQLSGGMQQRVAIARALAPGPKVLLLDEPFAALDAQTRRRMQRHLLEIWRALNITVVFITHDFLEAIKMGDHIAIMKDGEIVQIGTPEEIVAAPVDDYVREFTEDVPRYKVLSVGKVMRPARKGLKPDGAIRANIKIEAAIAQVADTDQPLAVVNEAEEIVGEIDREIMMRAMTS